MRNPFTKASRDARTAKMQARADRIIAEQNEKGRVAQEEAAQFMASQGGGASVGGRQATAPPSYDPSQPLPPLRDLFKQSFEYAKDSYGEMYDDRRDVLDPGDADLNKPPPELEHPAQREQWAADERAAREEARAPYLAETRPAVERTRFATTGRTQMEDVTERLKTFDPARVYGVYRVPDRYDLKHNNENRARVDWEIAHAPGAAGASEVHLAAFNRAGHWVQRRFGEPAVLDEDLAGALVTRARVEPEDCFGLPRLLQVRASDSDSGKFWHAHVEGILVLARNPLAAAHEQLQVEAPLALAAAPPFYVETLDWEAVAAWVAPNRHGPARTPSPLPHLPSSWEELTDAYLEVVGVRSEDCYGVQVTRAATENGLPDLSMASFRTNMRGNHELIHAAEHVVIAYRDRAEYEAGRERWRAYQDEVLHARLDHRSGQRPPLDTEYRPPPSFLSEVFDMFNPLDPLQAFPQIFGRKDRPQLGPYCGTT
jgi:hypothetical protein